MATLEELRDRYIKRLDAHQEDDGEFPMDDEFWLAGGYEWWVRRDGSYEPQHLVDEVNDGLAVARKQFRSAVGFLRNARSYVIGTNEYFDWQKIAAREFKRIRALQPRGPNSQP